MFRGRFALRKSILTRDTPSVRRRPPLSRLGVIGKINKAGRGSLETGSG